MPLDAPVTIASLSPIIASIALRGVNRLISRRFRARAGERAKGETERIVVERGGQALRIETRLKKRGVSRDRGFDPRAGEEEDEVARRAARPARAERHERPGLGAAVEPGRGHEPVRIRNAARVAMEIGDVDEQPGAGG